MFQEQLKSSKSTPSCLQHTTIMALCMNTYTSIQLPVQWNKFWGNNNRARRCIKYCCMRSLKKYEVSLLMMTGSFRTLMVKMRLNCWNMKATVPEETVWKWLETQHNYDPFSSFKKSPHGHKSMVPRPIYWNQMKKMLASCTYWLSFCSCRHHHIMRIRIDLFTWRQRLHLLSSAVFKKKLLFSSFSFEKNNGVCLFVHVEQLENKFN